MSKHQHTVATAPPHGTTSHPNHPHTVRDFLGLPNLALRRVGAGSRRLPSFMRLITRKALLSVNTYAS